MSVSASKKILQFCCLTLILTVLNACTKKTENAGPAPAGESVTAATGVTGVTGVSGASGAPSPEAAAAVDLSIDVAGLSKAIVTMKTAKGTVKFRLYSKDAPNSVKRFVELVQTKFFNGLSFHRVVPGFVVQTGDPYSRAKNDPRLGTGGSGQKLSAEINGRKHVRGTVAMARAKSLDSADSQFYICLGTYPHLDKDYTVVGQVIEYGEKVEGKDVLDRITVGDEVVEMKVE